MTDDAQTPDFLKPIHLTGKAADRFFRALEESEAAPEYDARLEGRVSYADAEEIRRLFGRDDDQARPGTEPSPVNKNQKHRKDERNEQNQ